jgi:hypothetical protein
MGLHEDQVPGVTFHFESSKLQNTADPKKKQVRVTLMATVADDELWEDMKQKFLAGMRIYKGEDFHAAITDAVKADLADAQQENAALKRELRQEKDARGLAERELALYKEPLAKLGSALRGG